MECRMALHEVPIVGFTADLICPERCASCGALVHPVHLFCAACWAQVHRLGAPECARCGCPHPTPRRCDGCADPATPIRTARAWASYHGPVGPSPVARAIANFKYGGARRLGRRLAAAMLPRIADRAISLVVPVPLHVRRLRQRGFNQSAVLARHLGRSLGCRVALTLVVRVRDTPSQITLDPLARAANVADAFRVRHPALVRGHSILVVDDVWTSGATVRAVAGSLRIAGAQVVDVLTVARVL